MYAPIAIDCVGHSMEELYGQQIISGNRCRRFGVEAPSTPPLPALAGGARRASAAGQRAPALEPSPDAERPEPGSDGRPV